MRITKLNWDYTKLAKNYDLRPDYSKKLIKKILININCKPNYPVADIGAGTGKLTKLLCENNLIVNAIEPNKTMSSYGKKNTKIYKNVNWSFGKAEDTGIKSNSVYCCFFGSSFNTTDYKKTFKEINRILIDGGFFCCLWNHRDLNNLHQKNIENIIKFNIPNYKYGDRRSNYIKIFSKEISLTGVKKLTQNFKVKVLKTDFLNAWKSHATLKKNCNSIKKFNKIINSIKIYLNSIKGDHLIVKYKTLAYVAKVRKLKR